MTTVSSTPGTLPPEPSGGPDLYSFLAPPQETDEMGRLGPYRVLKVLGHGGMGIVFLAEDEQLRRPVALKAMLPALAASESARRRFFREAQAVAAVTHEHIVLIYHIGEDRGIPYLAMPFLDGESLESRLQRESPLPTPEVLRIGRQAALGLAAAHRRGLVHRDVKPANVWIEKDTGRVVILDFGLARASVEEVHLTQEGAVIGTPSYMAPEQAGRQPVDGRADLFSLGCVLYRMTTGRTPFPGTDVFSVLWSVANTEPEPPNRLNPQVPRALSDLVMRLLAKDAGKRPAAAESVAQALESIERDPAGASDTLLWPEERTIVPPAEGTDPESDRLVVQPTTLSWRARLLAGGLWAVGAAAVVVTVLLVAQALEKGSQGGENNNQGVADKDLARPPQQGPDQPLPPPLGARRAGSGGGGVGGPQRRRVGLLHRGPGANRAGRRGRAGTRFGGGRVTAEIFSRDRGLLERQ